MSLASLRIAATALAVIEDGLRGGGTLNIPALEAFNAGIGQLAGVGMEPTDNQNLAFANLTEMLIDMPVAEAAAEVPQGEAPAPEPSSPSAVVEEPVGAVSADAAGVAPEAAVEAPAPATADSGVNTTASIRASAATDTAPSSEA